MNHGTCDAPRGRLDYSFRARLVYREQCPRQEILREYENWQKDR